MDQDVLQVGPYEKYCICSNRDKLGFCAETQISFCDSVGKLYNIVTANRTYLIMLSKFCLYILCYKLRTMLLIIGKLSLLDYNIICP